jgi:tetratricopeptide (TPR) repeat protein
MDFVRTVALLVALLLLPGCAALNRKATKMVADTLSAGGDTFTSDEDPEIVRAAVPFALKTYESLLTTLPDYVPLLTATCGGFTSYSYAFIQNDADIYRFSDRERAKILDERALKMYLRAHEYCARALESRFKGITPKLLVDPVPALAKAQKKDAELLYWSAGSWGLAMSLDPDKLAIDFPAVRALANRALQLDESWGKGSIHELMITLESQSMLGGSVENARKHFDRAVEIQKGLSPNPYVALAMGVSVPAQNRAEFTKLLEAAIAIDPNADKSLRLVTLVTQQKARVLLANVDALFLK